VDDGGSTRSRSDEDDAESESDLASASVLNSLRVRERVNALARGEVRSSNTRLSLINADYDELDELTNLNY
jgi:hypothetical protein